ncbi:MAG: hypothetical protein ACYCUM_13720 [Solirubrobacteraceae bacterium]
MGVHVAAVITLGTSGVLAALNRGFYELDCGEADLERIGELLDRYADMSLGIVDACVIACAERRDGRVPAAHGSTAGGRDALVHRGGWRRETSRAGDLMPTSLMALGAPS